MVETLEDQQSESPDIHRLMGIVRRRHLHFLIPLLAGWLLVWAASWIVPPRYKSSTLILVQQPTMPENYVAPNISDDLQARLESITQQILSRTRLLVIIDKLGLYSAQRQASADEKAARMRKDIDIELVRDPQKQDISGFRISYTAKDARLAQLVTGELASVFINENAAARVQASQGTTSFLEKQLTDARANLADQEEKVRQFENAHAGGLPSQQASNLQILAGLQSQLQNEQDSLNTAKQQHVYLEAMIQQEKAAQAKSTAGADGGADLAAIDQQLDKMKAQLTELRSRYTDKYPDVQSLKDQIASTEATRASLVAASRQRGGADSATTDPALRQLQGQLQANQLEITNREEAINSLKSKIGDYQGRLNAAPGTEQQLSDLTRGYDQSKANYDDLLKKKDQSEMATNMEQFQQGEFFTVLDPPSLPTRPDFPNHFKFCLIGLAIGLVFGILVAGGSEFMDDRLHGEKEIKMLLPIAVLSEVPEINTEQDARNLKNTRVLGWTATVVVFTVILAGSLFSYLHQ